MNFFSAFSVKYQMKSFPQIVHLGVSLACLSLPRGLGTDLACSTGHCWRIRRAARYTGSQPQMVCIFTSKEGNFGFCQFCLGLRHLLAGLQGQACSPWDAHIRGPQFTQRCQGWGILLAESGFSRDSTPPQAALGNLWWRGWRGCFWSPNSYGC